MMSSFVHYYQRPDLDQVRAKAEQLAAACVEAASADELLGHVRAWNRLRATVDTHYNLAMVRYEQNTQDAPAKAEQDFWDAAAPVMRELDVLYARTLVESRHAAAVDAAFGPQLRALLRSRSTTFVPEIRDAIAEEAALVSKYTRLFAKSEALFQGRKIGLSALFKYFSEADRRVRLEAYQSQDRFMADNSGELDAIYARMVELRDGMARALGHDSYIGAGYQLMGRTSYGPEEVAAFREAIVREIVPIAGELREAQGQQLGVERLLYHDELTWDTVGNPSPIGGAAAILDNAQRMYSELHPELGAFYELLRNERLLDVELREGKAGGGFCTNFADLGLPFVFANFNGSDADIAVITHECGHAFQAYSSRHLEPRVEYTFPTYEAAEVHSMSLEFLAYPWMELFFGYRAESYRRTHLRKAICGLPYTAAVDHFQHDVYANPGWTPAQRNRRWAELEALYLPHRSYGGLYPYLERGTVWQRQRHIYCTPFYYIDYALAEICALQTWHKASVDRERALADYLAICRVGGSVSFMEMLEIGNLRSPFEPATVREVAGQLRAAVAE